MHILSKKVLKLTKHSIQTAVPGGQKNTINFIYSLMNVPMCSNTAEVSIAFHCATRTNIHKSQLKRRSGKNQSPTFLDTTRATLKMTRPAILLLWRMYLLPR
jgi:hypothetical protein